MAVKGTNIEGDVSVGRNTSVGGNARVAGSVDVEHNVRVLGWFEAKNIKGPDKGLFRNIEKLREVYPRPLNGWRALVGLSLPAELYIAENGVWVDTGNMAGASSIESEKLTDDVDKLRQDFLESQRTIQNLNTQLATVNQTAESAKTVSSSNTTKLNKVESSVQNLQKLPGQPNGVAPLDEDAKIPESVLPSDFGNDLVFFSGVQRGVIAQSASSRKSSTDTGCAVIYDPDVNQFFLRVESNGESVSHLYYPNWVDAVRYGVQDELAWRPFSDMLYVDTAGSKMYCYNGTSLSCMMTEQAEAVAAKLQKHITESSVKSIVNANVLLNTTRAMTFGQVLNELVDNTFDNSTYFKFGTILCYNDLESGLWKEMRFVGETVESGLQNLNNWKETAGQTLTDIVEHGVGETNFALTPNILHRWRKMSVLTLTFSPIVNPHVVNEYMAQFESGETPTQFSFPSTVKWLGGNPPVIEPNMTYMLSIVDNVGIITGVAL